MKLTRFAIGACASPVVDPERGIGHLLDLGQQNPGADRVHGASLDQDAISRCGLERVHELLNLARPDGRGQFVAIDAGLQAGVDHAPWLGVKMTQVS